MEKKQKIALSALMVVVALSAGGYVVASNIPWNPNDPSAPFYEAMLRRTTNPSQTLKDIAAQQAERQAYDNLPLAEKQRRFDASNAKFEADMAARIAAQGPQVLPKPFDGILPRSPDPFYPGASFNQLDGGWEGHPGGVDTIVVSGANTATPNQGVLVMFTSYSHPAKDYLSPTATGPLKIISATGSIITLQSQAGTWDVYDINTDTHTSVTTKGGVTYKFNANSQTWVQ